MVIEALISYLLGSIPFSYIIPKLLKGVDVTKFGDRNIGAMNAYFSTKSITVFLLCFLFDMLKALIPTLLFGPIAVFSIIGHQFSIFIMLKEKFRRIVSGYGASSSLGYFLIISPIVIPIAIILTIFFTILLNPYKLKNLSKFIKEEQMNIGSIIAFLLSLLILVSLEPDLAKYLIILAFTYSIAYSRGISRWLKNIL